MTIMKSKREESTKKIALGCVIAGTFLAAQGCAYRLSNLHSITPSNIKTIYVEAVYDTGAEPVSHELLWDELQRAVAATGQLKLASATSADGILRAHVFNTQTLKSGERKPGAKGKARIDRDIFSGQQQPPGPGEMRDISIADDYFMKTSWSSVVQIELWDLNTRKLLLQRQYPLSGEIATIRGDQPTEVHHLRQEESLHHSFGLASRAVAERVVSDILHR